MSWKDIVVSIPHKLCDTQQNVCLYINILYVNGMSFLTTISKKIKYHTAMWVADHMAPTIANLVESVLKLYSSNRILTWLTANPPGVWPQNTPTQWV